MTFETENFSPLERVDDELRRRVLDERYPDIENARFRSEEFTPTSAKVRDSSMHRNEMNRNMEYTRRSSCGCGTRNESPARCTCRCSNDSERSVRSACNHSNDSERSVRSACNHSNDSERSVRSACRCSNDTERSVRSNCGCNSICDRSIERGSGNSRPIRNSCGCSGNTRPERSAQDDRFTAGCNEHGPSLAMVYSPEQHWRGIYDISEGLDHGTIFRELNLPFYPTPCAKGGCGCER